MDKGCDLAHFCIQVYFSPCKCLLYLYIYHCKAQTTFYMRHYVLVYSNVLEQTFFLEKLLINLEFTGIQ